MIINRNFLSILIALCLGSSVYAQFSAGIFSEVNYSSLTGDAPPGAVYKSVPEFGTGGLFEYNITPYVKMSFQPAFQRAGTKIAYSKFSQREPVDSIDINIDYFSVPLIMKVYGGTNIMYVLGGVSLGIKLNATYKEITSDKKINVDDSFNDINVAAIVGVGAQFRVGLFYVFVEGRYSQGLINIRNKNPGEPEELDLSFRTIGLQLFAGLTYSFGGSR